MIGSSLENLWIILNSIAVTTTTQPLEKIVRMKKKYPRQIR